MKRIAYMPLVTYPDAVPDAAVTAAIRQAHALGMGLDVSVFEVEIPQPVTPFGNLVLDIPDLVRRAEAHSRDGAERMVERVLAAAEDGSVTCARRRVVLGAAEDRAVALARLHDLSILPVADGAEREMAAALIFGSGRPVLLVPHAALGQPLNRLAVAWDGSRVAARALQDGLALLPPGGRVSILTVVGEKPLTGMTPADEVAETLTRRGIKAEAAVVQAQGRSVADALLDSARIAGADVLALGGFGHSRLRDFVLGGVTKDIIAQATMPVLLSH